MPTKKVMRKRKVGRPKAPKPRKVHTGPRGGKYVIRKGKKVYLKKK